MEQSTTCERIDHHNNLLRDPIITAHSSPQTLRTPVNIHRARSLLLDLQMPRIATMAASGSERLGHGVGQHEAMSDIIISAAAEHDVIEPNVLSNTCEWSAGRPGLIRMDLPSPADIANVTTNSTIEQQEVEASLSMNSSGISMPSSLLYQNPLNPRIDHNSNSNLAPFPTQGLGQDSNSNWQISRHAMEHQNANLNNSTDASRNSSNGLLRTMDRRSFSWFSPRSQVFPNDEDNQNETTLRQIQTSRRMTRSMRRRVVTNEQRQDIELRPLLDLNATVLTSTPQRGPILTRNRTSPPSHISNPNSAPHSTIPRNLASATVRPDSPNMSTARHPPLTTSLDSDFPRSVASRNYVVANAATSSSTPPKNMDRPVTQRNRKRSDSQSNVPPPNESRKRHATARNLEPIQPMSTRSQSSVLCVKKQKKTVDIKKTPAVKKEKEIQINNTSKRCCICLEEPTKPEVSKLDMCNHVYCFICIEKWAERENTCPLCKTRFHKIERFHKVSKPRGRRGIAQKGSPVPLKNVKKVKNRDQRSDYNRSAQWQGLLGMSNFNMSWRQLLGMPPLLLYQEENTLF